MSLLVFIFGFIAFSIFILIHVIIWRMCHPKRDYLVLAIVFFCTCLLLFGTAYLSLSKNIRIVPDGITFIDWVLIFYLYCALCGSYIVSYPALQAISPSLKIILLVGFAMPNGAAAKEIKSAFTSLELLDMRVQDLARSGLIIEEEGILKLTIKGGIMIKVFILLRKLLGQPIGRG